MNLYPLIKLLSNGQFQTGTQLGDALGVSRTAVWKQVQQLPSLGLDVITKKNDGYKLSEPLSLLDINLIVTKLKQAHSPLVVSFFPSLDSTNLELSRRITKEPELLDKQLVLVEKQTAGRGRRGREWYSPYASSLSISFGFKVEGGANVLQALSLAVAVVTKRVLAKQGVKDILLKWPNDLYLNNTKLGGILIELKGDLAGPCNVIIGLGINVFRTKNLPNLDQPIVFLNDVKENICRSVLAVEIALAIDELVTNYPITGFKPFQDEWNEAHIWKNQNAHIITSNESVAVTLGGVNEIGELQVTYSDGSAGLINAGEVSVRAVK